jgi:ribosomal protein S18 acetylase RimI-like enzyme
MAEPLAIRRATADDIPFLVEAIREAEKAGTATLSYCRIFGLELSELEAALRAMLREDLTGQELCISGFLLAEDHHQPAAACCAWVEEADGISSSLLKANLLLQYLDRERILAAKPAFEQLAALTISRLPGAIQIESVYVRESHRGRGLAGKLIDRHIEQLAASAPERKAQVILTASNHNAIAAYTRAGFVRAAERHSEDESLLALVPSLGKLLLERPLSRPG